MAAYEVLLLNTAIPQIQAAQSGDTYLVPRDIAFSAALTLSAGTANGVPYLNASKVLTTGSALTFDGTDIRMPNGGSILVGASASGASLIAINGTADAQRIVLGTSGTDGVINVTRTSGVNPNLIFQQESGELMRLTSTGLGIGTNNPGAKLHVNNSSGSYLYTTSTALSNLGAYFGMNASGFAEIEVLGSYPLRFNVGGGERMRLDSSGNLGLGVTPSAWFSGVRVLQFGTAGVLFSNSDRANLASNVYVDSGTVSKYIGDGFALRYAQENGQHVWYNAPSGTAGNAIIFTQAMTLDASGNLGLGATSPGGKLNVDFGNYVGVGARFQFNSSNVPFCINALNNAGDAYIAWNAAAKASSDTSTRVIAAPATKIEGGGGQFIFYNTTSSTAGSDISWSERARITSGGDFQTSSGNSVMVGGTAARATTAGTNRVDIFDGTAPVGTLANGVSFYSASGEANVMDAAGNATLLSPHDAETNEWIFRSKHTPTGKVLKIDVERLLKFVNDHFGLDAVHEFVEK